MTEIDLKAEPTPEALETIRAFAIEFFMDGGALSFAEWVEIHPAARQAFKQARDAVEVDRLRALGYLIKRG